MKIIKYLPVKTLSTFAFLAVQLFLAPAHSNAESSMPVDFSAAPQYVKNCLIEVEKFATKEENNSSASHIPQSIDQCLIEIRKYMFIGLKKTAPTMYQIVAQKLDNGATLEEVQQFVWGGPSVWDD